MDTYDYNEIPEENVQPQAAPISEEPSSTYSGTGTGRRESPYANSPYVAYEKPEHQAEPVPPKPRKQPKPGRGKRVVAVLLILVLLAGIGGVGGYALHQFNHNYKMMQLEVSKLTDRIQQLESGRVHAPGSNGPSRPVDGTAMTPTELYETSVNSVVAISTTIRTQSFYGTAEGASSGSGFILTEDGYVVTNSHVVDGATEVRVVLHDGTEYPAKIVGSDSNNDLAVLKVEAEGLTAAAIGSSSLTNIGDMVVAIGNPLGELASTMTVGYVSGIGREITTDNTVISMIQTDAAINPGNSGGPLFNMYGQVIGITTAKYSGTTGSGATIEGIGFAIPIDDVYGMITDIIDYGYVTGAYLAVTVQNMDTESAAFYNLPMGAYVVTVVEDGAADRAGIQPKDIITAIGSYKVSSVTDLTRALRNFKADETTTITVVRGGSEMQLSITLDEKPQDLNGGQQGEGPMPSDGDYEEWREYFFGPNGE